MRYTAVIITFATLLTDVLILCARRTTIPTSFAGGSLLTLFVVYCGLRFLGYCYVQRYLIWITGINVIYNSMIEYIKFPGWRVTECILIALLFLFEFLAIRRYYRELKNGELESAFHFRIGKEWEDEE